LIKEALVELRHYLPHSPALLCGIIFATSISTLPARADDPCGCNAVLAPSTQILESDERIALHFLNILEETSYEEAKKEGAGAITLPIEGVPLKFGGSYGDASEARRTRFQRLGFSSSRDESLKYLSSMVPSEQVRAWADCKQSCGKELSCWIRSASAETVVLRVAWRPTGNRTGTVTSSAVKGAVAKNAAPVGQLFPEGKSFESGYSESVLLERAAGSEVIVLLTVSGNPCDLTIEAVNTAAETVWTDWLVGEWCGPPGKDWRWVISKEGRDVIRGYADRETILWRVAGAGKDRFRITNENRAGEALVYQRISENEFRLLIPEPGPLYRSPFHRCPRSGGAR
jgi:hypothetical protein